MNFYSIILPIVFCLITVEGRNFHQQNTNTDFNENFDIKDVRIKPERRMRNRRQSFYNNHHDYLNAFQNSAVGDFLKDILFSVREIETQVKQGGINRYNPGYYDYRPNYSNKCEDTLKELLTLYKELTSQIKYTPPPPPQIIYVPYLVPATCNHKVDKTPNDVNITMRRPPNDKNQIWMNIPQDTGTEDDDDDGKRDVSFKQNETKRPQIKPPPFDHGSTQSQTTIPPPLKSPGKCEAAILSCCGSKTEEEREKCFALYNCSKSYKTGQACDPEVIMSVLDNYSKMYGPVNEL